LKEEAVLDAIEFKYPVPKDIWETAKAAATSSEVILGVRPQDVRVFKDAKAKNGLIETNLYTTEPLGDVMILDLQVGAYIVKAVVSPDFKIGGREKMWIRFPVDKVHLFDKKTGNALM